MRSETDADVEEIKDDLFSDRQFSKGKNKKSGVRRQAGLLADLAGGQDMAYMEYNKGKNKDSKKPKSSFFKAEGRKKERQKIARREEMG